MHGGSLSLCKCRRARIKGPAGRIWPAGRSLPMPGVTVTWHRIELYFCNCNSCLILLYVLLPTNGVFLKRFEEPKQSLKILQRFLKMCKFLFKQLLTAVSFTNLKIGGFLKLLNGSSSLKKTLPINVKCQI